MKIKKISISGLFNRYNHFIPLNEDDPITIIIGPNGYGKTTILRLIKDFFEGNYFGFSNPPFYIFEIIFDNDTSIRVYNNFYILASQCLHEKKYENLLNQASLYNDERIFFEYNDFNNPKKWEVWSFNENGFKQLDTHKRKTDHRKISKIREEIEENVRKLNFTFDPLKDNDSLKDIDIVKGYELAQLELNTYQASRESIEGDANTITNEPEKLKEIRKDITLHFIDAQRIINPNNLEGSVNKSQYKIIDCCLDLARRIQDADNAYLKKSKELDQTFAKRVIDYLVESKTQEYDKSVLEDQRQNIIKKLEAIEEVKYILNNVGLMRKNGSSIVDYEKIRNAELNSQSLNAILLYLTDLKEKLKVYNDLGARLVLFNAVIERLNTIPGIFYDEEEGMVFSNITGPDLFPYELSSGEQQAIILYYHLIFETTPNSYILIDEPEISWHISWQRLLIPNLQKIIKVFPLNFIIATHSPSIIHDRWDLTVELQGEPPWP